MQGLHGFILNWIFLNLMGFYEKRLAKRKELAKILKNPEEN